jgi:hypothetical protein
VAAVLLPIGCRGAAWDMPLSALLLYLILAAMAVLLSLLKNDTSLSSLNGVLICAATYCHNGWRAPGLVKATRSTAWPMARRCFLVSANTCFESISSSLVLSLSSMSMSFCTMDKCCCSSD